MKIILTIILIIIIIIIIITCSNTKRHELSLILSQYGKRWVLRLAPRSSSMGRDLFRGRGPESPEDFCDGTTHLRT